MFLHQIGIHGWREADENLLLASLLTGDPLLLIGNHGCAKTHIASKLGQALDRRFLCYDASKCMFEDVLGYPNIEKLRHGQVEYVSSPVTIWDKELVMIDELNRAVPELQSKWLEVIRSRRIMGFATQVKWIWAAMNPMSYSATNAIDDALIGRFAFFLYPPQVLEMDEEDRINVALHINGDDAPALGEWTNGTTGRTVNDLDVESIGVKIRQVLGQAAWRFLHLRDQLKTLPEFLARFAVLLAQETKGKLSLDGRRLGFLHRNLLANRAIEYGKATVLHSPVPDFVESARRAMRASIPAGLNDQDLGRDEAAHAIEICFDLLSSYFEDEAELTRVNKVYELFTTPDVLRKAELLLKEDLGEFAKSKAWTDLLKEQRNSTVLAYTALQVEARRPGTVPRELLASLSNNIEAETLSSLSVPPLENDDVEYVEAVEALLERDTDLERILAYARTARLVHGGDISPKTIRETAKAIDEDVTRFEHLMDGHEEGGSRHEDVQIVA